MKSPLCVDTSLQVLKLATKQKPFDLYRPTTGLSIVAENTKQVAKMSRVVDLSQNTEFLLCSCFVSFVWNRPKKDQIDGSHTQRIWHFSQKVMGQLVA